MAEWTIDDGVAARFAEAAETGRRLPRVCRATSTWARLRLRDGGGFDDRTTLPTDSRHPAGHRTDAGDDALDAVAGGGSDLDARQKHSGSSFAVAWAPIARLAWRRWQKALVTVPMI